MKHRKSLTRADKAHDSPAPPLLTLLTRAQTALEEANPSLGLVSNPRLVRVPPLSCHIPQAGSLPGDRSSAGIGGAEAGRWAGAGGGGHEAQEEGLGAGDGECPSQGRELQGGVGGWWPGQGSSRGGPRQTRWDRDSPQIFPEGGCGGKRQDGTQCQRRGCAGCGASKGTGCRKGDKVTEEQQIDAARRSREPPTGQVGPLTASVFLGRKRAWSASRSQREEKKKI